MSAALTYPGVYVREIPSGVRTITGVATSIAAFVGRTRKGPLDEPVTIDNFGDFVRTFGDLWVESSLGYAVRQFYLNGGGTAIVVRVAADAKSATFEVPKDKAPANAANTELVLEAAEPGSWANSLSIEITYPEPDDTNRFNIVVHDGSAIVARYIGVSIDENDPRFYSRVLDQRGSIVRVKTVAKDKADEEGSPGKPIRPPETDKPEDATASKNDGSDGGDLTDKTLAPDNPDDKKGIYALAKADIFNLLVLPPPKRDLTQDSGYTSSTVYQAALAFCHQHRAVLLVDPPKGWTDAASITPSSISDIGFSSDDLSYGAVYFPRLEAPDSERDGQLAEYPPSGAVAGVIARTDANRGVWKAPAGTDAGIGGASGLTVNLTDGENGRLNPHAINCLRQFPVWGRVVWGARTLKGDDQQADEYKYLPVRRLALYIEESLYRGLKWVVFEPNDEPLWSQIRLNVGVFMHDLFRQGAFEGKTPAEAYFVKCDKETTTQADIDLGIVNIVVGFAPLKPAEFVVLKIQQIAGSLEA